MPPTCTPEKKKDYEQEQHALCNSNEVYFTRQFQNHFKSPFEHDRDEERKQLEILANTFPELDKFFYLHKKVGSGTFSTVYLASLKRDDTFRKRYAVKHIVPTCHPTRIKTELKCLKDIGGTDNVAGIEICLRNRNNVIFIMPYQPHDSFSDYVGKMCAKELACYMRNLLKAIARVHKFNIVHRDIKPSNFLYDRKNKKFLLVDFGLAHPVAEKSENCDVEIKKKRKRDVLSTSETDVTRGAKRQPQSKVNKTVGRQVKPGISQKENDPQEKDLRNKKTPKQIILTKISPTLTKQVSTDKIRISTNPSSQQHSQQCKCYGNARTCSCCVIKKNLRALRAGTPGFRPPEVLLKLTDQDTAVDIWAAGIIMLSILSNCSNFFSSPDDNTALAEIILIFGYEEVKKVATQYGRYLLCSENTKALDLRKICCTLRSRGKFSNLANNTYKCTDCKLPELFCVCIGKPLHSNIPDEFPMMAYDLLKQLLDINPMTRISAEIALQHPFLKE